MLVYDLSAGTFEVKHDLTPRNDIMSVEYDKSDF